MTEPTSEALERTALVGWAGLWFRALQCEAEPVGNAQTVMALHLGTDSMLFILAVENF